VKRYKKICHAKIPRKQAGVAVIISEKVDFKSKLVRRDKEGYFILLKKAIEQGEITNINL
jgi:hypothetical protein